MMSRLPNITWRRLSLFAPIISLALMAILPQVMTHGNTVDRDAVLARNAEVAAAVDDSPYRVGQWIGQDVEVPSAAVEILRPNAILCRQFRQLSGGPAMTLLIVHCSDARDMHGHYPPVCYPANGWVASDSAGAGRERLQLHDDVIEVRRYPFHRRDAYGARQELQVLNFFILPDGATAPDIDVVSQLVRRYALSVQGVAQVQLVMSGDVPADDALAAAAELLQGHGDLLAVLGRGTDS